MKEKRWLRYVCLFALALLIAIPAAGVKQAQAATISGSCGDNATYKYNSSTKTLTISGSGTVGAPYGDWTFEGFSSDVTKIVIGNKITAIGREAFFGLENVKTVTIGKKCKSVGMEAFAGLKNLTTVDMGNSSVETIDDSAFAYCTKLKNITFSKNLTSIGWRAFASCENLRSIRLPSSLRKIGAIAFQGSGLTSVTIPKNVTMIGKKAFSNCTSLKTVTIGSGVKTIRRMAFKGCSALKTGHNPERKYNVGSGMIHVLLPAACLRLSGS